MNEWERPCLCETSACPEVLITPDEVLVRNSEKPTEVVSFTRPEWQGLVDSIKTGQYGLEG